METKEKKPGKYNVGNRGSEVYDQFGDKEKRRVQIDMGLSQLVLPPVTRGGSAKYRVCGYNPEDPQPLMLDGIYMFNDVGEPDFSKRQKVMKNTTGNSKLVKGPSGADVLEEDVEFVIFHNGIISVDMRGAYRSYLFLELHPRNKTSRFRNKELPPMFERIDLYQQRSQAFILAQEELEDDARADVRVLTDRDKIIGLATSAGIPTMENGQARDMTLLKSDLRSFATKDPRKYFSLSPSSPQSTKITILEADSFSLIEYNHDKKKWFTPVSDEPLHNVLAGEDPVESLVAFCRTEEGSKVYDSIKGMLDYWER